MEGIIKVLTTLVAINSTRIDNINDFSDILQLLEDNGFEVEVFEDRGVYNLYSEFNANPKNNYIDLAFVGHLDVVPEGDLLAWTNNPFELNEIDDFFYGRGVIDMKSSSAAFIQASLDEIKNNTKLNLAIILTGDEETDSFGAVALSNFLSGRGKVIKQILIGEPTSESKIGDVVKNGRRGSANFELTIIGIQGHVAYPDKAKNPFDCLSIILSRLKNLHFDNGTDDFQPSNLVITSIDTKNDVRNVIPGEIIVKFNIRYNILQNINGLQNILIKTFNDICIGYNFKLVLISNSDSFVSKKNNFLEIVEEAIYETTSIKPTCNTNGGTSDGRILHKIAPILEFGPLNDTAHKIDEKINRHDLKILYNIYRSILRKINVASINCKKN
jgi:succinyl-diaminopimelate desuccinylase